MTFTRNNKYAQEWTFENALERFEEALKYAIENDKCLCMQDAIIQSGIPSRTFYYLVENHSVLQDIKQDIHNAIISRVNAFALDRLNPVPASAAIWRMKQLGERDTQYMEQKIQDVTPAPAITVADEKQAELIQKLIDKFDKE